ncbi:MAG: hypothetical protein WC460_06710 [Patescibacteria group bacterium]
MISIKRLILSETLDRYGSYEEGNPQGAAQDLIELLDQMTPLIEKALAKAGPFVAKIVLDDFVSDFKERTKSLKMPAQASQLSNIMADVEAKEKELNTRDQEKKVPEEKPAAATPAAEKPVKKSIKVP